MRFLAGILGLGLVACGSGAERAGVIDDTDGGRALVAGAVGGSPGTGGAGTGGARAVGAGGGVAQGAGGAMPVPVCVTDDDCPVASHCAHAGGGARACLQECSASPNGVCPSAAWCTAMLDGVTVDDCVAVGQFVDRVCVESGTPYWVSQPPGCDR